MWRQHLGLTQLGAALAVEIESELASLLFADCSIRTPIRTMKSFLRSVFPVFIFTVACGLVSVAIEPNAFGVGIRGLLRTTWLSVRLHYYMQLPTILSRKRLFCHVSRSLPGRFCRFNASWAPTEYQFKSVKLKYNSSLRT